MIVLGISDSHNASAALLKDGKLVAAVQEERLTRVKNQWGMPDRAIEQVLALAGVSRDQVDLFAVANKYQEGYLNWDRESVLERYASGGRSRARRLLKKVEPLMEVRRKQLESSRMDMLVAQGLPREKTVLVEHHLCHAATAYYGQADFSERVLVLTADGFGDYVSATVNVGSGGAIERLVEMPAEHSIGRLYSNFTFLMGMVPLEHEYKLMGLAPYGEKSKRQTEAVKAELRKFFPANGGGLRWSYNSALPPMQEAMDQLSELLPARRFDYLAAGLQQFIEEFLTDWIRECIRETGIRRVALSGGVFMNVKANKCILEIPELESLYIFPSCGDETNSMGAAYQAYADARRKAGQAVDIQPLRDLYLGASIEDEEVEEALRGFQFDTKVRWKRYDDPEAEVARLLASGEVVARAAGRMEFGSRALGNRSILANPARHDAVRIINDMIKNRDFWMPFAPAMLQERSGEYVVKPKPFFAPYMIMALDSRPEKRAAMLAAIHPADHTARPQEVVADWNPGFHRLISSFAQETGEAVVLNTSFNLHGYPIVQTASDALDVLNRSGLQHVQVGNFVVSKE